MREPINAKQEYAHSCLEVMNAMNRLSLISPTLIVLTLSLFLGCSETGRPTTQKESNDDPKVLSRVPLNYDGLQSFLNEEETLAVEAVHQKYTAILKEWHANHGETVRDARAALSDFVATKDRKAAKDAIKSAKRDGVKELIKEQQAIEKEYEAAVLAAAPTEKLKLWQADKISKTLLQFLEPLQLTEDQVQRVHQLAPMAIQQIRTKDKDFWHAAGTSNLETLVGRQVLNAKQKQPFEDLKAKNRTRKLKWAL